MSEMKLDKLLEDTTYTGNLFHIGITRMEKKLARTLILETGWNSLHDDLEFECGWLE